jgi:hypothetical protein
MHVTIDLGIEADKPTDKGNIWSKLAVEKVIKEINRRTPLKCHFMVEMSNIGKSAIEIQGAELEDNRLKIHILTLGSREGKVAESLIREEKIKFLPMIETNMAYIAADNKTYVQDITKFHKIGIESSPVIREMIGR